MDFSFRFLLTAFITPLSSSGRSSSFTVCLGFRPNHNSSDLGFKSAGLRSSLAILQLSVILRLLPAITDSTPPPIHNEILFLPTPAASFFLVSWPWKSFLSITANYVLRFNEGTQEDQVLE
ncbi:hypothetical protein V2J09_014010 [Rumex salicifolius]